MGKEVYKIEYLPVESVGLNPENPRTIKKEDFRKLVKSLRDCPSLFDARPLLCTDRTGKLIVIGGNMRLKAAWELKYTEIPVIVLKGLTEAQEKEFAIKDNGMFGEWDFQALVDGWADLPLEEWGIRKIPEDFLNIAEDGEEMELEQSVQMEPPKEYILIMAEPNSKEREELKGMLKLRMLRRGGYKKGSCFDDVGLERVLWWNDFKERMKNADSDTK